MTGQLLEEIRDRLKAVCPFDIRISHSWKPVPAHEPFILLAISSEESMTAPVIQNGFIYLPVRAEITAAVYVPKGRNPREASRIFSKAVIPVMASYGCIRDFRQNAVSVDGITKGYKAEGSFKVCGYCRLNVEEEL